VNRAVVLSAVRTPIGRYGGALSGVRPDDLAAIAIAAAVERSGVDPASIDERSGDGFTALHFASFFGRAEVVKFLVSHAADVDAHGSGWMTGTPLHSATSSGHDEVVGVLLDAGADPGATQSGGWTPLHAAAHNGDVESVRLLLAGGADPSARNDEGSSVLEMAQGSGDAATAAAITEALDR